MSGSFTHTLNCRQPGSLQSGLRALEHSQVYASLPPSLRFVADLILDELASNAIKYGGPDCHEVRFELDFDGKVMRVSVADDGSPFNPWQEAPAVEADDTDLAALKIGGRGLHMIVQATDSQHYERRHGKNISTLTRRWPRSHEGIPTPPPGPHSP
jgi:serine/threonine-protein kinase RsbW